MRNRSKSVKAFDSRDDIEATNVLFELWRVSRVAGALILEHALADSGFSGDEFGVYSLLALSDEVTPSVLERWMAAPATTVSSYIKRLEARGHVSREEHSADRRSVVLRLTPDGARAHANAAKKYLPILGRVVEHLGADEPRVLKALTALRKAVSTARSELT